MLSFTDTLGVVMSKGTKKGRIERRKHPRSSKKGVKPSRAVSSTDSIADTSVERCFSCSKKLAQSDRALFVEEEVARVFCSEDCITAFFQPEIEKLEKEYFKLRPKDDLTPDEREQFAHLRWVTLQEPDEVWRQKTLSGDYRHTLISEFKPGNKSVWCVCTCLFLRGEPSFLYLAFPTKSASLVNHFRKGERVEWVKAADRESVAPPEVSHPTDGLAQDWTESETLRAEIHRTRNADDIPQEEFALYEHLLEKVLEEPDELWVLESKDDGEPDTYHFIRKFEPGSGEEEDDIDGDEPVWYVIIAQEAEDGEQLEILDHFPTKSEEMLQRFRRGRQELETADEKAPSKLVH